jgi:hypothetical protein
VGENVSKSILSLSLSYSPPLACAGSRCVSLHQNLFRRKPFDVMLGCLNLQTKDWKIFFFFFFFFWGCQNCVKKLCGIFVGERNLSSEFSNSLPVNEKCHRDMSECNESICEENSLLFV